MKIAIITGASSGLGREFARAVLLRRRTLDEIWVLARRADRLEDLKAELGEKIVPVAMDLTDRAAVNGLAQRLEESRATVALLINNAGYGKLGDVAELPVEDNIGMIDLNCTALTHLTAVVLPFMTDGGEIINTCSIASFAPNTRLTVYSSTKAYVMSFSRGLRQELKNRNINVCAVCPGPMETEFLAVANIAEGASHTFDTLPRVDPRKVAVGALAASKNGRAVVTEKFFYRFYRLVAKILPTAWVMKMAQA